MQRSTLFGVVLSGFFRASVSRPLVPTSIEPEPEPILRNGLTRRQMFAMANYGRSMNANSPFWREAVRRLGRLSSDEQFSIAS